MSAWTTKGRAQVRGRYALPESTTIQIGDPRKPEFVGIGSQPGKENSDALVHEFGGAQQSLPLYAVASAVASGIVVPFDALVESFEETGNLPALKAAIKSYEDAQKKS